MKKLTQYDRISGVTVGYLEAEEIADLSVYTTNDVGLYEGTVENTEYVIDGSPPILGIRTPVTPILTPSAPVEGDIITLSGLPDPCWVQYGNEVREIIGGSISGTAKAGTLSATLVGAYSGSISVEVPSIDEDNLNNDSKWQAIQTATPAQIQTWLTNNVTNLTEARDVLKILILAVRKLNEKVK